MILFNQKVVRFLLTMLVSLQAMGSTMPEQASEIIRGTYVVSLVGEDGVSAWLIDALEKNMYNDLSGYERMLPVQKLDNESEICPKRRARCLLEHYQKHSIDALLLGEVSEKYIKYSSYDVKKGFLVGKGKISIKTMLRLRMGAFEAFKDFLRKGGILDDREIKHIKQAVFEQKNENNTDVNLNKNKRLSLGFLFIAAMIALLPFLLSSLNGALFISERRQFLAYPMTWFFIVHVFMFALAGLIAVNKGDNLSLTLTAKMEEQKWVLTGIGGVLWGALFVWLARIFPLRLHGIERSEKGNILKIIIPFLLFSILKVMLVAVVIFSLYHIIVNFSEALLINSFITHSLIVPAISLYLIAWFAFILDMLAIFIDRKVSLKKCQINDGINSKIKSYFVACLKRNGVAIPKKIIDKLVFISSDCAGVLSYRGGFGLPRIAINKDLLFIALSDYEKIEFDAHRDTGGKEKNNDKLSFFGQTAIQSTPFIKTKKKSFLSNISLLKKSHGMFVHAFLSNKAARINNRAAHKKTRTNRALSGIIMPSFRADKAPPSLLANNKKEFDIVSAAIGDHFPQYYNDKKLEIDDSDEQDYDFLFGAILMEIGSFLRRDDVFSTFRLFFTEKKILTKTFYMHKNIPLYSTISDGFVALHHGLGHLMQYLYFMLTKDTRFLSSKGLPSVMQKAQTAIIDECKDLVSKKENTLSRSVELERIAWLSNFYEKQINYQSNIQHKIKRLAKISFLTLLIGLLFLAVLQSYFYSPFYNDLIEWEKQKASESIKKTNQRLVMIARI